MHVVVDSSLCEGHGLCVVAAPDIFELDDDDILTVLNERPGPERRSAVEEAVTSCPKRAIRIVDE